MSLIRFLHVDHLRLGSPLTGLMDCPEWLVRSAENAVRQSVSNLVESAITRQCQFVLIAGRLAESAADLPAVLHWLSRQFRRLHQHGIQLVIADERIRLSDLPFGSDVQLLTQNNCLNIQFQATGELRLAMRRRGDWSVGRTLSLLVDQTDPAAAHRSSSGGESSACDDRASGAGDLASEIRFAETRRSLTYIAAPAIRADQERRQVSVNGVLRTTAGAPQAVHPAESGAFGAMFVEADSSAFTIQTEFVPLDCIRFEQQEIRSELVISAAQLDALLKDSCTRLTVPPDRTLVVDWTIHAPLEVAGADVEEADVDERHLLAGLRRFLQVGHSGIWPRRIRYADDSRVVSANRADAAVTEFLKVAAERTRGAVRGGSRPGAPLGSGLGTAAGLDFLERAA